MEHRDDFVVVVVVQGTMENPDTDAAKAKEIMVADVLMMFF